MILSTIEHLSGTFDFTIATTEPNQIPEKHRSILVATCYIKDCSYESYDLIWIHKVFNISILQRLYACKKPVVSYVHDHEYYCLRRSKYFPISRTVCTKKAGLYCLFPCAAPLQRDRKSPLGLSLKSFPKQMKMLAAHKSLPFFNVASQFMKEELKRQNYSESKTYILPPFIDTQQSFQETGSANQIFYIGQITRGKGLDTLIQALTLVDPNIECHVIGEGNYMQACIALAKKLRQNHRIQFHGKLPWDKIENLLLQGGIGVFPSMWPEPFGMTGPEMMMRSIPIVASNVGGVSDWCHHNINGLLFEPKNFKQCANQINALLQDPIKKEQMALKAKELAEKNFSIRALSKSYIAFFSYVLSKS